MQDTAASLYDMSEYTLEYDLLKVNVFYNSLMEKTITDEKDYDVTVCICMLGLLKNFSLHRMAVSFRLLEEVFLSGWAFLSAPSLNWLRSEPSNIFKI